MVSRRMKKRKRTRMIFVFSSLCRFSEILLPYTYEWVSEQFFPSLFRDVVSLAGNLISWQSTGGVDRHTYRAPNFLMYSCCAVSCSLVVRMHSHTLTSMHLHGSSHEAHCLRFAQKHSHIILVAQCRTHCRT